MGNNMTPNIASSGFPHVDNVNAFGSLSTFNYSLWAANCKLTITRVPWDSDYKDVVKFASANDRDAYFAGLASSSQIINKAVRVPKNGVVQLPFNYDEVMTYNYLITEYPLPYGYSQKGDQIKTKYYYFIKDMEYKNTNVTEAVIELDIWTTFIDDVSIGESCLHRGHAPMTLKSVEQYLADPTNNTDGLLTPDVNFGEANNVKKDVYTPFNTNTQYVLVATTSNPSGSWSNNVTIKETYDQDGIPNNVYVFAVLASDFAAFITYLNTNIPQMIQTIQALFVVDSQFITLGTAFSVGSISCYPVVAEEASFEIALLKADFDIPSEYDWITKLYTSPYSVLEITDNNGKIVEIKVENTSSDLGIHTNASFAFPFLDMKAFITGIGGKGSSSYAIKKFTTNQTKEMFNDNWQHFIFNIDVPTYGIFQKSSVNYDFATKFDRAQAQNNANTSYNNTAASNVTSHANTERSLDNAKDIATKAVTTNNQINSNNVRNSTDMANDGTLMAVASVNRAKAAAWESIAVSNTQIGAALAGGGLSAAFKGASGDASGAINTGLNAIMSSYQASLILGLDNTFTEKMYGPQTDIVTMQDLDQDTDADAAAHGGYEGAAAWSSIRASKLATQKINTNTNYNLILSNGKIEYDRDANYNTGVANNDASKATADANNVRTKSNAEVAIQNGINQAALRNNIGFSKYSGNGALDAEGLRGIDIKIKTQNDDLLRKTGNIFARYGYMYDDAWTPASLNLMTYFTYWEFSDIWLYSNKVFEGALSVLRDIFTRGVTVWRNPSNIGTVSIKNNHIA